MVSYLKEQATYLKHQKKYVEKLENEPNGFGFVSLGELVQSLRSMGYNYTFKAIAELIDNSIEALSSHIIIAFKKEGKNTQFNQVHVGAIAVIDDGYGMEPKMLRAGLRYGGTHRYNNRDGIGRFGMGLPGACGSMTERYSLYSKLDDNDFHSVDVSLHNIVKRSYEGKDILVPTAKKTRLPNWIGNIITKNRDGKETNIHNYLHGTVVHIDSPDRLTTGYVNPSAFIENMKREIGTTYRNYLENNNISILEYDERNHSYSKLIEVQPVDPLFLREDARFHSIEENDLLAMPYKGTTFEMKGKDGKMYPVRLRYSLLPPGFARHKWSKGIVKARRAIMNRNLGALTLTRAGRQMSVVKTLNFPDKKFRFPIQNNDAFWNVEVDFHPGLDEQFHVPSNKQSASPGVEAWVEFQKHAMPTVINQMRSKWKLLNGVYTTKLDAYLEKDEAIDHEHDTVERIIHATRKKETKNAQSEEVKEGIANKKAKIKKELEEKNTPDDVIDGIMEDVDLDYEFREEEKPESPFYRVDLDANTGKVVIYLNTTHLFYQDLYANATIAQRDALKLLIYALADTEINSSPSGRMWYKSHRPRWSESLTQSLDEFKSRYSDDTSRMMDMSAKEAKKAAKAQA